jgi:hypothetical protein
VLRTTVNLPEAFATQPAPAGFIMATDFTALLAPLDEARGTFGHGPFGYTAGIERSRSGLSIQAGHITQLREALR